MPVWLWIAAVVLITIHATFPSLSIGVSMIGFFVAVSGVVLALTEEEEK